MFFLNHGGSFHLIIKNLRNDINIGLLAIEIDPKNYQNLC